MQWQDSWDEGGSPGQPGGASKESKGPANPFAMPSDEEIFLLRDQERERKKAEREVRQNQKIWEKGTWTTRISVPRRALLEDDEGGDVKVGKKKAAVGGMDTQARRREKENMAEFIAKKREMFLVQMSLDTKKAEIKKLEEAAKKREEMLDRSERMLQEDQDKFEDFLKKNDKMAHQAIQKAEKETKAKQDKMTEIKKLNTQIMHLKSKNLKTAEALEDCNRYAEFLESITPKEYKEEELAKKAARRAERQRVRRHGRSQWWHNKCAQERAEMKATINAELAAQAGATGRRPRKKKASLPQEEEVDPPTPPTPEEEKGNSSSGEDIPMYFTEPQQLLNIFAALGESNLFLIENCQETEEALEELKQKFDLETAKTHEETADLDRQIAELERAIEAEEEKKALLEQREKPKENSKEKQKKGDKSKKKGDDEEEETEAQKNERQAQHMESLQRKITEVYELTIGANESNIDAIPMLTQIEKRLEQLLDVIGTMDPEFVAKEEAARDKERREARRLLQMEEKEKEQMLKMAERQKRAAQPVMKKTGKPLMTRHMQQTRKKTEDDTDIDNEEEDIKEFFMDGYAG